MLSGKEYVISAELVLGAQLVLIMVNFFFWFGSSLALLKTMRLWDQVAE